MMFLRLKQQADEFPNRRSNPSDDDILSKPLILSFAFLFGILFLQFSVDAVAAEPRTWTSADGKNTIVAEMTRLDGTTLYLRQPSSGKNFKVDLSQMSSADGQFAREQAKLMSESDSKTTETTQKERLWTSADGTQQLKAEFVAVSGDDVQLKAANGVLIKLPLAKFSQADLDYIKQVTAATSLRKINQDSPPSFPSTSTPDQTPTSQPINMAPSKELSAAEVASLTAQLNALNQSAGKLHSAMYYRKWGIEQVESILKQAAPIAEQLRVPAEEDVAVASKIYAYESLVKNLDRAKQRVKKQGGAGIPVPDRFTRPTPKKPDADQNNVGTAKLNGEAGNSEFEKYSKPDHQTLLRMYYAANGDVLKDDFPFAMEVYTTMTLPPLDPKIVGTGGRARLGYDQQWYDTSREYSANEFTRQKIEQQIKAAAAKELAAADAWKAAEVFRLRWNVRLNEYDFKAQIFPFIPNTLHGQNYSIDSFSREKVPVPRAYLSPAAKREYGKDKSFTPNFRVNFRPSQLLPTQGSYKRGVSVFSLSVSGLDELTHLPIAPDQAELLLQQFSNQDGGRSGEREVIVEGLVQVGPITIADGKLQEVPAQLVSARVLHPFTEQELYRFKVAPIPAAESPSETNGFVDAKDDERVPEMARMRMALLQFREHPELLNSERLAELTRRQILTEQKVWKQLEEVAKEFKLQQAGRSTAMNLNPRQPIYTYSWRDLQSTRQELANGPLLEIFAGNDRAWSYLRREPNWDDRFKASVAGFLFSREQVVDQPVESAAVAMQPEVLSFVKKVAEQVPNRLAIPVSLTGVTLNSERTALIVDPRYSSRTTEEGEFKLLSPIHKPTIGEPREKPGVGFPQSAKDKTLYQVRFFPESIKADPQIGDWLFSGNTGAGMNRAIRSFQGGATFLTDYPAAVALDREITFDQIPLTPDVVKALTDSDYLRKHSGERAFEARIIVSSIHVDLATAFSYDGTTQRKGVIVGTVDGIRILTREGDVVAFIPATSLPKSRTISDNNPFTPEPSESTSQRGSTEAQELTPAMIPLMIAKFQPEFFEKHLDQFIVTRLQHEYWFRTDPIQNTYGVDQTLGEALPVFADMPDAAARKSLITKFQAWSEKNMERAAGSFTIRFDDVEFKHAILQTTPSPAFFHDMRYGSPFYGNPFRPIYDAESAFGTETRQIESEERFIAANKKFNAAGDIRSDSVKAAFTKRKENAELWTKAITSPPREIYFSTRRYQYVVPDSNGNRSTSSQGASMGGRSSGGIAGIPIAKPATEPIFPVLSIDKEIWLPENAAIDANGARLQLEITANPADVEIQDQPAPHPWIEAYLRYSPNNVQSETKEYRSKCDAGHYAMIHANLQAARIVNADTGATVLQLVLREPQIAK